MSSDERPADADGPSISTIDDLIRNGRRLAILCEECSRFRYMRAERFSPSTVLADMDVRCGRCLSPKAKTIAVERNAANGHWPAESA